MALRVQPGLPVLGTGIAPATDGPGGRFHLARHLANAPANVQQGQRHTPTNFQLVFGACGSHMTLIGTTDLFL
jgi:hypothetical protein